MRREAVEGPVDRQALGQPPGPNQPLHPPDQDRGGMILGSHHQVQHLVDPIAEVHVPMPAGSVKHFCSGSSANPGMRGEVGFPVVGLHFGDDSPLDRAIGHPPGKHLAEQTLGQFDSIFCSPIPFGTGTCLFSGGE